MTRDNFEPAVSVGVHDRLDLPRHALNFDITNACLGFVNAMTVASTMIDAGAIDYALIVAGEDPSPWHRTAVRILNNPDSTREDVLAQFATLDVYKRQVKGCLQLIHGGNQRLGHPPPAVLTKIGAGGILQRLAVEESICQVLAHHYSFPGWLPPDARRG